MKIVLNGEFQEISLEYTVSQLLEDKALPLNTAVVELNREIIKREHWQSTILQAGDTLEVLVFMGGG